MHRVIFESPHLFNENRIRAAAVYCSDGRWGENFDDFEYQHLQLMRYDRFAIPGGPATLTQEGNIEAEVARSHMQLLIEAHGLKRVALIQHDDCAYYLQELGISHAQLEQRQADDLARAAQTLRNIKGELSVDAYLALRSGPARDKVIFRQVAVWRCPLENRWVPESLKPSFRALARVGARIADMSQCANLVRRAPRKKPAWGWGPTRQRGAGWGRGPAGIHSRRGYGLRQPPMMD